MTSQATSTIKDKLGRDHVKFPNTGPSVIYLRNNFFHDVTCLEHVNDLAPLCTEMRKIGKGNMIIIADNGPDYHPSSYKNLMLFGKLFKEANLDMPTVTTNPAGLSAHNPIEHLWSPCSNALTSVVLSSTTEGSDKPPYRNNSLSQEEKDLMNKKVLDNGALDIAACWSSLTFDGHPVIPVPVPSDGRNEMFQSSDDVVTFLASSTKHIKNGHHKDCLQLLRFLSEHVDRRKNEFTFTKCQFHCDEIYEYCQLNPPIVKRSLEFVRGSSKCMLEPTLSPTHENHYMTFLEMAEATENGDTKHFAEPGEGCSLDKEFGKCLECKHWIFHQRQKRNGTFHCCIPNMAVRM